MDHLKDTLDKATLDKAPIFSLRDHQGKVVSSPHLKVKLLVPRILVSSDNHRLLVLFNWDKLYFDNF